jgi:hypothetical protein
LHDVSVWQVAGTATAEMKIAVTHAPKGKKRASILHP